MKNKFNKVAVAYAQQCHTCGRTVEGFCPWCYYGWDRVVLKYNIISIKF